MHSASRMASRTVSSKGRDRSIPPISAAITRPSGVTVKGSAPAPAAVPLSIAPVTLMAILCLLSGGNIGRNLRASAGRGNSEAACNRTATFQKRYSPNARGCSRAKRPLP